MGYRSRSVKRSYGALAFVCLSFFFILHNRPLGYPSQHRSKNKRLYDRDFLYKTIHFAGEIVVDAVFLCVNLFSVDSAKIITAFTPFYLITRRTDESIQNHFYDPTCHKNCHQLPKACYNIARHGIAVPMVGLSSLAIFSSDPDLALTARMLAIGLPLVQSGKDVIKTLEFKCCLRPWHQDFSKERRSTGGFPSGHIANVSYMASLFGIRHGPAWAVPLTAFGLFVAANFLVCNRHYLSQLVAGAGLGLIFAVAASKVVDTKLERWSLESVYNGFKIGYSF
jgi:hypothetical protein